MHILGISCYYHDSAAALIRDGEIVAAAQEERFTRKKHDQHFPQNAIDYCLKEAGISGGELDHVIFYEKPLLKFERILETYVGAAPWGIRPFVKAIPVWSKQKLWVARDIRRKIGFEGKALYAAHHESHAASAFFTSPFEEAVIVTADGVGEWATTSIGVGNGNRVELKKVLRYPHSLGMLYSAFTYYTGFKVNSAEYKVMGLAPYGEGKYTKTILDNLIDLKDDGSFRLNMDYFDYFSGLKMTNRRFDKLFGGPPRVQESKLTQREMDLAKSVQEVTETVMDRIVKHAVEATGKSKICLAGGVALNCVANGKIYRDLSSCEFFIQPASGDAGGALGAAILCWHQILGNERKVDGTRDLQKASLLGPAFTRENIKEFLDAKKIPYQDVSAEEVPQTCARLLNEENVLGFFQGRMEYGPRALGCRSILGDARSAKMQSVMNLKIKFRESFRPFAPIVLQERVGDFFDFEGRSPYMLLVADVKKSRQIPLDESAKTAFGIDKLNHARSDIPAITHVDYSARLQTVEERDNPQLYALLKAFEELTGYGILVNTSFNVRGEPIVCTPEDAYQCFMRTNMDYLLLECFLLDKKAQSSQNVDLDWQSQIPLD